MKGTTHATQRKEGGILILAMGIMLFLSILTAGLFKLQETGGIETVYMGQSKQAFWQAEIGLRDAVQRLRFDESFRDSASKGSATFSVTNAAERVGYVVTAKNYGGGNSYIKHYIFEIVSVGWVDGMNRRISQRIETKPGFLSAIMAPENINIGQNTLVSGPIMVLDGGELIIDDKIPLGQEQSGDFDIIILGDGAEVNKKKSGATEGQHYDIVDLPVPDGVPDMPDFSSHKSLAEAAPLIGAATNLGTVFLAGDLYLNCPAGITVQKVTGSGRIVNTGGITIKGDVNAGGDVSSGVSFISFGNVTVEQKTDFMGDTLIYAETYIYFGEQSTASARSVLLADGMDASGVGITMGGHSQFEGIVFADEGDVIVEQGSNGDETRIEGTVISGDSVTLGQNSEIIFNPDVFNPDYFDLSKFFELEVVARKISNTWRELPSL